MTDQVCYNFRIRLIIQLKVKLCRLLLPLLNF